MNDSTILYIHGMGGGSSSRIPSILREYLPGIVVRTYDFNPDEAQKQLRSWIDELHPVLLVGESLGSVHTLILHHIYPELPIILVSPALNAPVVLSLFSPLTWIPGVTALLDRIYKPRPGDRQPLHFTHSVLSRWRPYRALAVHQEEDINVHAFVGTRDHYRRSGIVSLHTWHRHFPEGSYTIYEGTHFMEECHVRTILLQKILSTMP